MNIATLEAEGEEPTLASLATELYLPISDKWKRGDPMRNTGVYSSSGFIATLAKAATPGELILVIRKLLIDYKERGIRFNRNEALSSTLSVGFTVGDSVQFVACFDFTLSDLKLLTDLGIGLSVSAYPTSDEANQ
jgi:hypothetical protein